ncbi:uncharacterized protein LOC121391819 [Gigantopelta aegis]|uniref:uncharacterized protein LOC121391819 n=1 Tax=Gigantopelta aegis TaxID=1735272 RepID=UPI001B88D534|nr:uncharacterized protein LOC121391819 [Gigantopelta aegis]
MSSLTLLFLLVACLVLVGGQKGKTRNFPKSPFHRSGKVRGVIASDKTSAAQKSQPSQQQHRVQRQHRAKHNNNYNANNIINGPHGHHRKMPKNKGKAVGGTCQGKQYQPRTHICCSGVLQRRQGMRPACCNTDVYDYVFDLCCNGKVTKRTLAQPVC